MSADLSSTTSCKHFQVESINLSNRKTGNSCTGKVNANASYLNLLDLGQHWSLKMFPGVLLTLLMLLVVFFFSFKDFFSLPDSAV